MSAARPGRLPGRPDLAGPRRRRRHDPARARGRGGSRRIARPAGERRPTRPPTARRGEPAGLPRRHRRPRLAAGGRPRRRHRWRPPRGPPHASGSGRRGRPSLPRRIIWPVESPASRGTSDATDDGQRAAQPALRPSGTELSRHSAMWRYRLPGRIRLPGTARLARRASAGADAAPSRARASPAKIRRCSK